jgi:hypothetical protein
MKVGKGTMQQNIQCLGLTRLNWRRKLPKIDTRSGKENIPRQTSNHSSLANEGHSLVGDIDLDAVDIPSTSYLHGLDDSACRVCLNYCHGHAIVNVRQRPENVASPQQHGI